MKEILPSTGKGAFSRVSPNSISGVCDLKINSRFEQWLTISNALHMISARVHLTCPCEELSLPLNRELHIRGQTKHLSQLE